MRRFLVLLCILLLSFAVAVVACSQKPTKESFSAFLKKFETDERFRLERIVYPLVATLGNESQSEVQTENWSKKQVIENLTVPLAQGELVEKGLKQSITWQSKTQVLVFQYRPEADSYQLEYYFREVNGRWYLAAFRNFSM